MKNLDFYQMENISGESAPTSSDGTLCIVVGISFMSSFPILLGLGQWGNVSDCWEQNY